MKIRTFPFALAALAFFAACKDHTTVKGDCIKGRYLGQYCNGAVIQILDERIEGKSWKADERSYENCLVANFDSTVFSSAYYPEPAYKEPGTIFYFKFREGGYAKRQFDLCEPTSFVTIIFTSPKPCL